MDSKAILKKLLENARTPIAEVKDQSGLENRLHARVVRIAKEFGISEDEADKLVTEWAKIASKGSQGVDLRDFVKSKLGKKEESLNDVVQSRGPASQVEITTSMNVPTYFPGKKNQKIDRYVPTGRDILSLKKKDRKMNKESKTPSLKSVFENALNEDDATIPLPLSGVKYYDLKLEFKDSAGYNTFKDLLKTWSIGFKDLSDKESKHTLLIRSPDFDSDTVSKEFAKLGDRAYLKQGEEWVPVVGPETGPTPQQPFQKKVREEEEEEPEGITLKDVQDLIKEYNDVDDDAAQEIMNAIEDNSTDEALKIIDKLLKNHGVESIKLGDEYVEYSNTGDTYASTIVYDGRYHKFYVSSWGDIVEKYSNMIDGVIYKSVEDNLQTFMEDLAKGYIDRVAEGRGEEAADWVEKHEEEIRDAVLEKIRYDLEQTKYDEQSALEIVDQDMIIGVVDKSFPEFKEFYQGNGSDADDEDSEEE